MRPTFTKKGESSFFSRTPLVQCVICFLKESHILPIVIVLASNFAHSQFSLSISQVFDCLQQRELNVTVLSDSSVSEYKTADYLCGSSTPFLRSLKSRAFTGASACGSLEQPNIVTGLPAAGTTNCMVSSSEMKSS